VDNAYIESFNGSLRDERLNTNWFLSIEDAQQKLEAWRRDYNQFRPNSSLGNRLRLTLPGDNLRGTEVPISIIVRTI